MKTANDEEEVETTMATQRQTQAARRNVRKAIGAARSQRHTGASEPKTRQELYEEARGRRFASVAPG
jgi:hypothetical protein